MRDKEGFAKRLRILMEQQNITQTALAAELGLSSSAISLYCTGKAYPEVSVLIKLASYLGVSTDYLLTGIDPDVKSVEQSLGISENAAASLYNAMRDDSREFRVSHILEFLLKSREFYDSLEHCAKGYFSQNPSEARAAILMCSPGISQVIDSELRIVKETPSPNSDN